MINLNMQSALSAATRTDWAKKGVMFTLPVLSFEGIDAE